MPGSVLTTYNTEDQILTSRDVFATVHSGGKDEVWDFMLQL